MVRTGHGPGCSRAAGFVRVELLRCAEQAGRYVTVDRWRSRADFDAFKCDFAADYAALDRRLEGIAASETRIGAFDALLPEADGASADGRAESTTEQPT